MLMIVGQRQLGDRWEASGGLGGEGGLEPAMKTDMTNECFCLAAVSSILVRIGSGHYLLPRLSSI